MNIYSTLYRQALIYLSLLRQWGSDNVQRSIIRSVNWYELCKRRWRRGPVKLYRPNHTFSMSRRWSSSQGMFWLDWFAQNHLSRPVLMEWICVDTMTSTYFAWPIMQKWNWGKKVHFCTEMCDAIKCWEPEHRCLNWNGIRVIPFQFKFQQSPGVAIFHQ